MKTIKILKAVFMLFFLYAFFLSGCKKDVKNENPETPKALQEQEKQNIREVKLSDLDLTEQLYAELVEKSPELKKLEEDLDQYSKEEKETYEIFSKYNSKSNDYYMYTNSKAGNITDSLLRKRILSVITKSQEDYRNKTSELYSVMKLDSLNSSSIKDQHIVLKVILTLPVIQKYQTQSLPDKKGFNELLKRQEKLKKQIEKLIPPY